MVEYFPSLPHQVQNKQAEGFPTRIRTVNSDLFPQNKDGRRVISVSPRLRQIAKSQSALGNEWIAFPAAI